MAKLPLVKCCICQERDIDRDNQVEEVDYIKKGTHFYHMSCYKAWKTSDPVKDEDYKAFIFDFIARDLKVSYDYHMCKAQIDKFVKENHMTNRGIFFALKYFYEIKHGDWEKGHGGIGIVPYVYQESCSYWAAREKKSQGVLAEIERQMVEAQKRSQKVVTQKQIKPRKFIVDLDAIAEMEED